MELTDIENRPATEPIQIVRTRVRPPSFVSEFEPDIKGLYLRMMDEPVPARLIGILRAGLAGPKP